LLTIPISIIANVFRVVFLAFVSEIWGAQYATGTLHTVSGFMVFALAYLLLMFCAKLLE
jgi:exosortase/archaeosortase family protein